MTPDQAYAESVRLLLEYHGLMRKGLDDSPQVAAIREGAEGPWLAMDEVGRERIGHLSVELYEEMDAEMMKESGRPHN